ncbi:hypothetical protein Nmel_008201 [Mimus melanotis]
MEIMIDAKPSLLWNLLTTAVPFLSLFTVASPPAMRWAAHTIGTEHRRGLAAMCPKLGTSRPALTVRVTSSSGRWVSVLCPFLRCKAHPRCGGDIHAESPPPGGVLRAAGPGDTPAPSQTPGSARLSVTGTTENNKGKGCEVGKARTGSPWARLASNPAAAVRVAPQAVRGCAAEQSGASSASPVLRRARSCERGGTGRRLRGNHRGKPTEDA